MRLYEFADACAPADVVVIPCTSSAAALSPAQQQEADDEIHIPPYRA
jgi:hypothetical protein